MAILTMTLLIVLSIGLFWAGIQLSRLQSQLFNQQKRIKRLFSELNGTTNASIGIGNRLHKTERQLKSLKNEHQDMISFGKEDRYQKRTYKQATQMVQMGASVDELKKSCELSQGEAELLSHMNLSCHT